MDREYLIAAFCGVLGSKGDVDRFLAKYHLTEEEKRRAACLSIQYFIQTCQGQKDVDQVNTIATRFGISSSHITSLAWEVLRGSLGDNSGEVGITRNVLKYFLSDQIPSGCSFGYTGLTDQFCRNPLLKSELVLDLCYVDRGEADEFYESLPEGLNELLKEVEACSPEK